MTLETDNQLFTRTLAGDLGAGQRLMERYRNAVWQAAYHALGNRDDAWDVAQESLVYGLTRLAELREPTRIGGWLRQITLSLCADYRRRRGTRRLGEPIHLLTERGEEVDYCERLAVRLALEGLSDAHRTTLLLHYVGGWSLEEVAGLLDIPVNTVRSRLGAAKRLLRADLGAQITKKGHMPTKTPILSEEQTQLIALAFPGAKILSTQTAPEPWQPFSPRVRLALPAGDETVVDFRGDITPEKAALLTTLHDLGIPGPRLVHDPVAMASGWLALCRPPAGENLSLWTLGGTPHRIRVATECAFEAIDRLQNITGALAATGAGQTLPHRTLADEAAALTSPDLWAAHPWLSWPESEVARWREDAWFVDAARRVQDAVAQIHDPLVYTHYLHFFPNVYRIHPAGDVPDGPLGYPGDSRPAHHRLAEITEPFGHYGDPLLGLAMVWIYDCYPFVHTGFVEQFLMRRNVSRREFAPRLALMALQTIARQLPVARPDEHGWWDSVRAYAEQGLAWM